MYYLEDDSLDEEDCVPVPSKVRDRLFLSGSDVAECKTALKNCNITHILNLKGGKQSFPKVISITTSYIGKQVSNNTFQFLSFLLPLKQLT